MNIWFYFSSGACQQAKTEDVDYIENCGFSAHLMHVKLKNGEELHVERIAFTTPSWIKDLTTPSSQSPSQN